MAEQINEEIEIFDIVGAFKEEGFNVSVDAVVDITVVEFLNRGRQVLHREIRIELAIWR
jgi:hypothetical protein